MNKFTKGILSLGITLSILAGATGVTAFAAQKTDKKEGEINHYYTVGSSSIEDLYASAYTSYGNNGSVYLSSTLDYIDLNLLKTYSETKTRGHYRSASLDYRLHSHCRTIRITSQHDVYGFDQHWNAKTTVVR